MERALGLVPLEWRHVRASGSLLAQWSADLMRQGNNEWHSLFAGHFPFNTRMRLSPLTTNARPTPESTFRNVLPDAQEEF
jgi:hypothetical protein